MIRHLDDFEAIYGSEREKTLALLRAIDPAQKDVVLHPGVRTLERLAWHLTQTLTEMPHRAGLLPDDPLANQPPPAEFTELIRLYEEQSARLLAAVAREWSDASLGETVEMYGEAWSRGQILTVLVFHEVHHRAEMIPLMRLLGLRVPGLFGPAREEWAELGIPAPE
ncbi:MAG: hypothetical protein GX178_01710 [Acidobacteria bacterium]|jgi:uncharacterized damage-inducible protein DinB|nr:DinB family protein [Thermoanaerobaculia bacterium]NLN10306.1 hypothetical protein [Acidobacteriota bacterium]MBP7812191.1 DinB family protein [Thermoanaerobaculia bacterium]MBP8844650.1 DinB family protein [Thermoanaerobaculia bacterium]HPA94655.1 DinB family protein [Thermoanaerobaculia bacterium]